MWLIVKLRNRPKIGVFRSPEPSSTPKPIRILLIHGFTKNVYLSDTGI